MFFILFLLSVLFSYHGEPMSDRTSYYMVLLATPLMVLPKLAIEKRNVKNYSLRYLGNIGI